MLEKRTIPCNNALGKRTKSNKIILEKRTEQSKKEVRLYLQRTGIKTDVR